MPVVTKGTRIRCVREKEERTNPICTPIREGKTYEVLAVRDADGKPPRDPERPDEVKIIPGDTDTDKLGWWIQFKHFEVVGG